MLNVQQRAILFERQNSVQLFCTMDLPSARYKKCLGLPWIIDTRKVHISLHVTSSWSGLWDSDVPVNPSQDPVDI